MTSSDTLDLVDLASVYALRAIPPADPAAFGLVAGERGRLTWLSGLCLLLYGADSDPPTGVSRFCLQTAPRLLPQLNRKTELQRVGGNAGITGRIDWSSTLKARLSEDASEAVFVLRENNRVFDRPENQLVKFLIDRIQRCLDNIPAAVWAWHAWGWRLNSADRAPFGVEEQLATLAHRARVLAAHISLRGVTLPETAADQQVAAARTARNPLYSQVVETYLLYRGVVETPNWNCWRTIVEATLPLPPEAHDLADALTGGRAPT